MKSRIMLGFLVVALFSCASLGFSNDYERLGEDDHPLRIAAYVLHPAGVAIEYAVTRPIHWFTKQTELNKVFGSDNTYEDVSFVWE